MKYSLFLLLLFPLTSFSQVIFDDKPLEFKLVLTKDKPKIDSCYLVIKGELLKGIRVVDIYKVTSTTQQTLYDEIFAGETRFYLKDKEVFPDVWKSLPAKPVLSFSPSSSCDGFIISN